MNTQNIQKGLRNTTNNIPAKPNSFLTVSNYPNTVSTLKRSKDTTGMGKEN